MARKKTRPIVSASILYERLNDLEHAVETMNSQMLQWQRLIHDFEKRYPAAKFDELEQAMALLRAQQGGTDKRLKMLFHAAMAFQAMTLGLGATDVGAWLAREG